MKVYTIENKGPMLFCVYQHKNGYRKLYGCYATEGLAKEVLEELREG